MDEFARIIANGLEAIALAVLLVGTLFATVRALLELWRDDAEATYRGFRRRFGRAIILSLEFLVAADIIGTVAIDPSFANIGILAAIVAVRTFLSFSIELETEGRWPWRATQDCGTAGRGDSDGRGARARPTTPGDQPL